MSEIEQSGRRERLMQHTPITETRSFSKGRDIDFVAALANAEQVYKQMLAEPDLHDQSFWFNELDYALEDGTNVCGTTRCAAGWSLHFAGWGMRMSNGGYELLAPGEQEWKTVYNSDDFVVTARDLMGLTHEEANQLFLGCDNRQAVKFLGEHVEWLRARVAEQQG